MSSLYKQPLEDEYPMNHDQPPPMLNLTREKRILMCFSKKYSKIWEDRWLNLIELIKDIFENNYLFDYLCRAKAASVELFNF
ncbi:hypothetical protein BpHYR1_027253 [Brachionus plicatilis]|uniref:Uncharacterized protein n=1 Tax=Brachionus plicatilis TaxID=10195 RepID=A0A3M7P789_BRAPC|nr:hypothetical protein BpHYR1_027253 [Brachionus plicatilis]